MVSDPLGFRGSLETRGGNREWQGAGCARGQGLLTHPPDCGPVKAYSFHPDADEEHAGAALYYARIDPELARRLYEEIERLILNCPSLPCPIQHLRVASPVP